MAKVLTREKQTIIDEYGVVIKDSSITTSIIEQEDEFIKLYLIDLAKFKNIPSLSIVILFDLSKNYMDYTTNVVTLVKYDKVKLAELYNCSLANIEKTIKLLKGCELLIPLARSKYLINPLYIAKTKWSEVKRIRATIDYTPDGKKFMVTEFTSQKTFESAKTPELLASNFEKSKV